MSRLVHQFNRSERTFVGGSVRVDPIGDRAFVEAALEPVQGFTRVDRLVIVGAAVSALATLAVVVGLFCLLAL